MDIILYLLSLITTGSVAGFASGMVGVGGCFIMVPVQYWLLVSDGLDSTLAIRVAFATGLAVTLPTVMTSALGHHRRKAVDWQTAIPMGGAAVVGAVTGGTIATFLPGQVLKTFFAVLVTLMAVRMFWNVKECLVCPPRQSLPVLLFIGFCIGNITSLAGVGGGVVLVPVLVLLLHYPVHTAIGTSSACLIFSSAGAVATYLWHGLGVAGLPPYSIGYVDLVQWGVLVATTIPLSIVGVKYAHRCPAKILRYFFAVLMFIVGVLMLIP
ncbi:sulfite exporter TauE/SafE family protein [Methanospirillum lacunae]|uniref:Probable membrane transporter protein n=1 Tax=Methanospirillum lacunae TaxID=668570 RepID=A0A2V2N250_9EURY|nr:sulfite exporter TauE/SafE family protein [Methanospirillum lacunae]PWR72655.1 sulfite exporter TauE/SafE family protein [Methanospirillum lacunae]